MCPLTVCALVAKIVSEVLVPSLELDKFTQTMLLTLENDDPVLSRQILTALANYAGNDLEVVRLMQSTMIVADDTEVQHAQQHFRVQFCCFPCVTNL